MSKLGTTHQTDRRRSDQRRRTTVTQRQLKRAVEKCSDCGCQIWYPSLNVRFVYNQCPYCMYMLECPTPLSLPPPHPEILSEQLHALCMARTFDRGNEVPCQRIRRAKSDYCRHHKKLSELPTGLPYGRIDKPYVQPHPIHLDETETFTEVLAREKHDKLERERKEKGMTYDALIASKKEEEAKDPSVADTVLLAKAKEILKRERIRGKEKFLSTERLVKTIEPTFGIKLKSKSERVGWLKRSVQAFMVLPEEPFTILSAVVGDKRDPNKSADVTDEIKALLSRSGGSQILIGVDEDIVKLLCNNVDPCPEEPQENTSNSETKTPSEPQKPNKSFSPKLSLILEGEDDDDNEKDQGKAILEGEKKKSYVTEGKGGNSSISSILQKMHNKDKDESTPEEPKTNADDDMKKFRKMLRIRYCMNSVIGEVTRSVIPATNCLTEELFIRLDYMRDQVASALTIVKASYGHPNDLLRQYDVTEKIQGIVDSKGAGKFVDIPAYTDMSAHFGEPCSGVNKFLNISYKVDGKIGDVSFAEAHDHLIAPVVIKAPMVSPALTVTIATLSPKKTVGRSFSNELKGKEALLNYSYYDKVKPKATKTSIRSIDNATIVVTDQIRNLFNEAGGDVFSLLEKDNIYEKLNSTLGESSNNAIENSNEEMLLHIEYRMHGKLFDTKLTTDKDGNLRESFSIDGRPYNPSIFIHGAVYGHPSDPSLQFNVAEVLDKMVRNNAGRELMIGTGQSLSGLFGDPCYPLHTNKILQIRYEVKNLFGQLEVETSPDGRMLHGMKIGWPTNN